MIEKRGVFPETYLGRELSWARPWSISISAQSLSGSFGLKVLEIKKTLVIRVIEHSFIRKCWVKIGLQTGLDWIGMGCWPAMVEYHWKQWVRTNTKTGWGCASWSRPFSQMIWLDPYWRIHILTKTDYEYHWKCSESKSGSGAVARHNSSYYDVTNRSFALIPLWKGRVKRSFYPFLFFCSLPPTLI